MRTRVYLMLVALAVAPGCKKLSMVATSEYAYDEAGYGGDGGNYDEAMSAGAAPMEPMADIELAEADDAPVFASRELARERRAFKSKRKAGRKMARTEMAAPAPESGRGDASGGEAPPSSNQADSGKNKPAQDDKDPEQIGRQIIYTATMQISVFNLEDAMATAEALPERYGGYIQSMSPGSIVLRIPAQSLRKLMDEVGGMGVVENRTLQAQDVTDEYVDVVSRIEVLERTQTQMMELLAKARTVKEALDVRQALDRITMELEVLKGRLRYLENQVGFSTLTLSIIERGPHTPTPSSNDPFPWVDSLGVEATEWR